MYVKLDYDPNDPLPADLSPGTGLWKKGLERYLDAEALSMPAPGYRENKSAEVWRERAVIVIFNVAKRENLEPLVPYLAMNYYDRYISRNNPLPVVMKYKQNDLELLCICCLTLACKMRDRDFSVIEFQGRHPELANVTPEKFLTMELHILQGIDWHLRAVMALCFVRFFAPEFDSTYGFRRRTINQILIHAQNDFKKTQFRPSVMAASAFLAASSFLYPEQFQSFVDKMTSKEIFREGDLLKCTKGLIRQCKELNILIESAVAENEYIPRKKVRAEGEISEDEDEITIRIDMAETSAQGGTSQRLRESDPRPLHKQVIPESSEQAAETSAAVESQREASETRGRATAEEKPKEAASKSSEKSKEMAAKKSEQATAEEAKDAAERSNESIAKEAKPASTEKTEEINRAAKGKLKEVAEESQTLAAEETKESAAKEGAQSSGGVRTASKGKEKASEVEMTEIPKMAEDSEDLQMAFPLRWRLGETNADDFVIFTDIFDPARAGRGRGRGGADPEPPGANLPQAQASQLHLFCDFCCGCCCCSSCCNPF